MILSRKLDIKVFWWIKKIDSSENWTRSLLSATQVEINNRTNVDPTLHTNFRLSADSRNDNDVLRWWYTENELGSLLVRDSGITRPECAGV